MGSGRTKNIFEEQLADEEGHTDFLKTQLDLVAKYGEGKYVHLNASKLVEIA